MTTRHGRYLRPYLEIEFDRDALTQSACCRFVPIVLRLCAVPEGVMNTVSFERVRVLGEDGVYRDDYEVHPRRPYSMRVEKGFPGYQEYATHLLARPHAQETGTIHIKIESQSSSLLSEVVYRFDSREQEPVRATYHDGSFRGIRIVSFLRTTEERDALCGQYPVLAPSLRRSTDLTQESTVSMQQAEDASLRNYWMRPTPVPPPV